MAVYIVVDSQRKEHFLEAASDGVALSMVQGSQSVRLAQGREITDYYDYLTHKEVDNK